MALKYPKLFYGVDLYTSGRLKFTLVNGKYTWCLGKIKSNTTGLKLKLDVPLDIPEEGIIIKIERR